MQIIFEELGCADYWSCPGGLLSLHEHAAIQPQLLANQAQVRHCTAFVRACAGSIGHDVVHARLCM